MEGVSATRRLVVCADDYAFTPGVSRAIRELLARRAISATSVMAASRFWPEEAAALREVAGDADIGLHVTLTDQTPLGAMPTYAPDGKLPPIGAVFKAGLLRRLPLGEIEAEIERQLASFIDVWGRPPAHIDGHHHVQQLPGVRDIVVRLAKRVGGGETWVRSGAEPASRVLARGVATAKSLLISSLGRGIRRTAARAGVPTNDGFSGAYDYQTDKRPMAELFQAFIKGAGENALLFCHPGYNDATLEGLDGMTTIRDAEQAFLLGDDWPDMVAKSGLEIGPYRRNPAWRATG
ncbi:MAG TPA: ChbG/HpnK family deacetylase [Hyphomicrobiaceae bacterium]|nr:ChbG/HpnK family deacetylase [Hyphomicrobiaceae bacterium]